MFKWLGTVLCMLTAVAWAFSRLGGTVSIGNVPLVNEPELTLVDGDLSISLGMAELATNPPRPKYLGRVNVSLICPLVALAIPTALLWITDRSRPPSGHCQKCGYDLTGNISGRCPECGTAAPPTAPAINPPQQT